MRCRKNILAIFIVFAVCLILTGISWSEINQADVVDGRFIIMLNTQDTIPASFKKEVSMAGGKIVKNMPEIGILIAESWDEDFPDKIKKCGDVESVIPELKSVWGPDSFNAQAVTTEDPFFDLYQWNLKVIDAVGAWQAGFTGKGARIALLDTGINPDHPDFKKRDNTSNIDHNASKSCVPDDVSDNKWDIDLNGHGTYIAGIVAAADNNQGMIGVAPEATVIAVKVLAYNDKGLVVGELSWILEGILYAATQAEADVINMSLTLNLPKNGHMPEDTPSFHARIAAYYLSALNRAVNFASKQGVTVICAAGNYNVDLNHDKAWVVLPAQAGNAMAVSATGPYNQQDFDAPALYTNYGTSVVDVAAPGGNNALGPPFGHLDMVLGPYKKHPIYGWTWVWQAGTSVAAAHVSGLAALIISKYEGDISPGMVKAIIRQTADDLGKKGTDPYYGHGRINALKAVLGIKK